MIKDRFGMVKAVLAVTERAKEKGKCFYPSTADSKVRCLYSKELNCYGVRLPEGNEPLNHQIGRASCRERVSSPV